MMSGLLIKLNQAIRVAVGLLVLGALWVGWALISEPSVDPQLPPDSLFEPPTAASSEMALDSVDFVFRPLFETDRRPAEGVTGPLDIEVVDTEASEAQLEDVTLIGVFASGDAQGVILRKADGTRFRLVEGEEVDGWRLQSVEPRSAVFASGSGGSLVEDRIDMGVVSVGGPAQPTKQSRAKRASSASLGLSPAVAPAPAPEKPVPEQAGVARADSEQQPAPEENASEAEEASAPTFDSIYKKRAPRGAPRDSGSDTNS
jgi:hypothetical protein